MAHFSMLAHSYTVTLGSGMVVAENVSRVRAAFALRLARQLGRDIVVAHTSRMMPVEIDACYGCKARPVTFEQDCDGVFATSSCESPQCDWWAAMRTREADETRERLRRERRANAVRVARESLRRERTAGQ